MKVDSLEYDKSFVVFATQFLLTFETFVFTRYISYIQFDADQLRRQRLQCSWTSSLELSADGPRQPDLSYNPFRTVANDIFIGQWDCSVNPPLTAR